MDTYPEITFVSTAVEQADDDEYSVTGDLTIKGVTKPVTVDFEYTGTAVDPYGNHAHRSRGQDHRSTARTGASTGTPPSMPAACSSARR